MANHFTNGRTKTTCPKMCPRLGLCDDHRRGHQAVDDAISYVLPVFVDDVMFAHNGPGKSHANSA